MRRRSSSLKTQSSGLNIASVQCESNRGGRFSSSGSMFPESISKYSSDKAASFAARLNSRARCTRGHAEQVARGLHCSVLQGQATEPRKMFPSRTSTTFAHPHCNNCFRPTCLLVVTTVNLVFPAPFSSLALSGMAWFKRGSMTVVIIAHRLSTVKNSHKICVIKGGQARRTTWVRLSLGDPSMVVLLWAYL